LGSKNVGSTVDPLELGQGKSISKWHELACSIIIQIK